MQSGVRLAVQHMNAGECFVLHRISSPAGPFLKGRGFPKDLSPSLVTEEAALGALGVDVSPVGEDEGQVGHTTLQQPPQVLSHELVSLL